MKKLVIKVTVYKEVDPDLYESVNALPLRRRAALIRRLWREGLKAGQVMEKPRLKDAPRVPPNGTERTAPTADQKNSGPDAELLRRDLAAQDLSELSAFV